MRERLVGVHTHLAAFAERSEEQRQEVAQAAAEDAADREARAEAQLAAQGPGGASRET